MNEQHTQLVSGAPVPEDHSHAAINPSTGLQRDYVVLSAEERAKGFVKPLRDSYRHVGRRPKHPLRDLTPEELARDAQYGYVKFEAYPESELPRTGRYWTEADLESGCGQVTTMHRAIAETYARNPEFYSGTFCSTCRKHFHLEQFRWEPDGEPMYVPDQAAWHEAEASKPQPPAVSNRIILQPCPFCGGPPVPFHKRVHEDAVEVAVSAHVFCHECGAQGQSAEDWFEPGDSIAGLVHTACELWNGRDTRHGGLYKANAKEGHNVYPRQGDPEDRA